MFLIGLGLFRSTSDLQAKFHHSSLHRASCGSACCCTAYNIVWTIFALADVDSYGGGVIFDVMCSTKLWHLLISTM
jgi:hypothetical protein